MNYPFGIKSPFRQPGSLFGRGIPFKISQGIAVFDEFLGFSTGTFSRESEASYYSGSFSAIGWAPSGTLRVETHWTSSVGESIPRMAVIEGARTNVVRSSEDFLTGTWTNGAARSGDVTVAPDGVSDADLLTVQAGAGNHFVAQQPGGGVIPISYGVFVKKGSQGTVAGVTRNSSVDPGNNVTPTDDWQLLRHTQNVNSTGIIMLGPATSSNITPLGSGIEGDNHYFWGGQMEYSAPFTSMYIRTSASANTRQNDQLNFVSIPSWMRNFGFKVHIAFEGSSNQIFSGSTNHSIIESTNGNNWLQYSGSLRKFVVKAGGVTIGTSSVVTFDQNQVLTLTANAEAGTITVAGASSGDGTYTISPWTWADSLYGLGHRYGSSTNVFFGRISEPQMIANFSGEILDYLAFEGSSFTRSSEGSYYSGSFNAIGWSPTDQKRIETFWTSSLGNSVSQMVVIEGARTNQITFSELITGSASWTTSSVRVGFISSAIAPPDNEGGTYGLRQISNGQGSAFIITADPNTARTSTIWVKKSTGSVASFRAGDPSGGSSSIEPVPDQWSRIRFRNTTNDGSAGAVFANHLDVQAGSGIAGDEHFWWGAQDEHGHHFPSMYIRTSASTATRAADQMNYISLPYSFRSGKFRVHVAFDGASDNLKSGSTAHSIFESTSGNNWLQYSGALERFTVKAGGTVIGQTGIVRFNHDQLISLTADTREGTIHITGALLGNGVHTLTPWSWASSSYGLGHRYNATNNAFFGRISRLELLQSSSVLYNPTSASSATLVAWWAGDSLVHDGVNVTAWNDKSGNDYHLSLGGGETVQYLADFKQGQPAADLAGTGHFTASHAGLVSMLHAENAPFTMFTVFRNDIVSRASVAAWHGPNHTTQFYALMGNRGALNYQWRASGALDDSGPGSFGNALDNVPEYLCFRRISGAFQYEGTTNKGLEGNVFPAPDIGAQANLEMFRIGPDVGATLSNKDITVAELLIYTGSMSFAECRAIIDGYIVPKYQLTGGFA